MRLMRFALIFLSQTAVLLLLTLCFNTERYVNVLIDKIALVRFILRPESACLNITLETNW